MRAFLYPPYVKLALNSSKSWYSGQWGALLLKSSYLYSPDHDTVSDLNPAANEVSAPGYARVLFGFQSYAFDFDPPGAVGKILKFPFPAITFPVITATGADAPRYCVVYEIDSSTDDSFNEVYFVQDFEAPQDLNAELLQINPPAEGFIRVIIDPTSVTP